MRLKVTEKSQINQNYFAASKQETKYSARVRKPFHLPHPSSSTRHAWMARGGCAQWSVGLDWTGGIAHALPFKSDGSDGVRSALAKRSFTWAETWVEEAEPGLTAGCRRRLVAHTSREEHRKQHGSAPVKPNTGIFVWNLLGFPSST